jgi:restriction system protein
MAQLRELQERIDSCRARYWSLSKDVRIEYGLRAPVHVIGYTAYMVFGIVDYILNHAFSKGFPILVSRDQEISWFMYTRSDDGSNCFATPNEAIEILEPLISDLESRLDATYAAIGQ